MVVPLRPPDRIEADAARLLRLGDRRPARVVFRDQHDRGLDQSQRAHPFAQELGAHQVSLRARRPVAVDHIVAVEGLGEIDPETVEVKLRHQHGGAADEQLTDHLAAEIRRCPA